MVMKMKRTLMVRFANESVYYSRIDIDVTKIKNEMVFPNEVFFEVDGVRVAVQKEDWEEIKNEIVEQR